MHFQKKIADTFALYWTGLGCLARHAGRVYPPARAAGRDDPALLSGRADRPRLHCSRDSRGLLRHRSLALIRFRLYPPPSPLITFFPCLLRPIQSTADPNLLLFSSEGTGFNKNQLKRMGSMDISEKWNITRQKCFSWLRKINTASTKRGSLKINR